MKKAQVIKIGGSVITNKGSSDVPLLDEGALKDILEGIDFSLRTLIVFGVGSFGHNQALKLGLKEKDSSVPFEATDEFRSYLDVYYNEVVNICREFAKVKHLRVKSMDVLRDSIKKSHELVNENLVVMFGSVIDENGKSIILSGDTIALKLAKSFDTDLIFYTDADGVFMKDGEVIDTIASEDVGYILKEMEELEVTDSTGGMRGKLRKIKELGFKNYVFLRSIDQN